MPATTNSTATTTSVTVATSAVKGDEPGLCEAAPFYSFTVPLDTNTPIPGAEGVERDSITPEQEDQLLQPQPGDMVEKPPAETEEDKEEEDLDDPDANFSKTPSNLVI